jgi:hypothetical protein
MPSEHVPVIGIDFDNTLAIYDELFRDLAAEQGLIAAAAEYDKRAVRDAVRRLPDGETQWQKLQAAAYGPRIAAARLADGAGEFLERCARRAARVYIVSHKTELAAYDETRTSLRQAAIEWMKSSGIFRTGAVEPAAIYFGDTRQEKIDRIGSLGCTHFVDDLAEVFAEPSFPMEVEKILYQPQPVGQPPSDVRLATSWNQIGEWLFGSGN